MGLFWKFLGKNCWVQENRDDMVLIKKNEFGVAISLHGSINLSMGSDTKMELKVVDADGQPKKPIKRSIRKILMGLKVNGVRLWQVVMMAEKCGFEGYYPNRKGSIRNC